MRNLGLQGTKVTSEGIKHLQGMTKLHQLNLALTVVESVENLPDFAWPRYPGPLSNPESAMPGWSPLPKPGFPNLVSLILFPHRGSATQV